MPPKKGKKRQVTAPTGPHKRQEPLPPCRPNCNCLGCLDGRSESCTTTTEQTSPPREHTPPIRPPAKPSPLPLRSASQTRKRTVVLHHQVQGSRWMQEDNKGIEIAGLRWLLQVGRRLGKAASSPIICRATPLEPGHLGMERKLFRTTEYDWDWL